MTNQVHSIDRRTFLKSTAAVSIAGLAGCQTLAGSGNQNVKLDPPENYEQLKNAELPYPIYGERFPEATVPSPFVETDISTRQFVGDRHVLLTFVYTRCGSVCPALTSNLVQVQADAAQRGYSDEVALLATTFDPEYDTAERLRDFGEGRGANLSADNWYFLRPDSEAQVEEVVVETFGHAFQKNPSEEGMMFLHNPLLILANKQGYVERSYTNKVPNASTVVEDVRSIVE